MIRRGDTYTLPRDMSKEHALEYCLLREKRHLFGKRMASCSEHIHKAEPTRRRGARRELRLRHFCRRARPWNRESNVLHSLEREKKVDFARLQFNFVVSTNERAVKLWASLGFEIVAACRARLNIPSKIRGCAGDVSPAVANSFEPRSQVSKSWQQSAYN